MTATTNDTCTQIDITSSNLSASNTLVEILVSVNGAEQISINPAPSILSYTLLPAALGMTTFAEGTYSISLYTTQSSGDQTSESACALVICDLGCEVLPLYTDVKNLEKILAYEALIASKDCVSCSCSTSLILYNIIKDETNVNHCGCS